jgi:hypothetical protein
MDQITDLTSTDLKLVPNTADDDKPDVGDFSDLNDYLMNVVADIRREKLIDLCQNLAALQHHQVQPDVDRLMMMSNDGEAPSVLDDLTRLLFEHAYDQTKTMGFNWNDDIEIDQLFLLADIIEGAMLLQDMEDYGDISSILDGDGSVEEKVVDIWGMILDKDMHHIFDQVESIEPEILNGIIDVTVRPYEPVADEDVQKPLDFVVARLVIAKDTMRKDSIAWRHIASGGALGVTLDSLITLYTAELQTIEAPGALLEELVYFTLISDTPDALVNSEAKKLSERWNDDIQTVNLNGTIIDRMLP